MNLLRRYSAWLPALSVLLLAGVSLFGWMLNPERAGWFIAPLIYFMLFLLDAYHLRWAGPVRSEAVVQVRFAMRMFLTASAIIAVGTMLAKLALDEEFIARSWGASILQARGLLIAVAVTVMGNYIPKLPSPWSHREEPFDWQGVHRFTGFVFMLVGVACFVAWVLLPVVEARAFMRTALLVMAVIVVLRKWYSVLTWQNKRDSVPS
jgi:uncharacterized membrane protein